jgi:hypothetical protein
MAAPFSTTGNSGSSTRSGDSKCSANEDGLTYGLANNSGQDCHAYPNHLDCDG